MTVPPGDLPRFIELCKVADVLAFCVHARPPGSVPKHRSSASAGGKVTPSSNPEAPAPCHVDQWGRSVLSVARALGMPAVLGLVRCVPLVQPAKRRGEARKEAAEALLGEVPRDSCRVFCLDTPDERTQVGSLSQDWPPGANHWLVLIGSDQSDIRHASPTL